MPDFNLSDLNPVKIIIFIVAVVIGAGIVFFGLSQFKSWQQKEVDNAVEREKLKFAARNAELEEKISKLEEKIAENRSPETPGERMTEVFGKPAPLATSCEELEKRISAFFSYLDEKRINTGKIDSVKTREIFEDMISDLAGNPPVVVGETRDLISLMHNQAHFFRTLDKDRIGMVLDILSTDRDVLEPAAADLFSRYVSAECGPGADRAGAEAVSLSALYDYAGFFLETLGGKSYLMRRDSALRSLTLYYSVLVLDLANDQGLNSYGIDIRSHIKIAINDIRSQSHLAFKDRYLARLIDLQEKYG